MLWSIIKGINLSLYLYNIPLAKIGVNTRIRPLTLENIKRLVNLSFSMVLMAFLMDCIAGLLRLYLAEKDEIASFK